jgi:hypothetical protein
MCSKSGDFAKRENIDLSVRIFFISIIQPFQTNIVKLFFFIKFLKKNITFFCVVRNGKIIFGRQWQNFLFILSVYYRVDIKIPFFLFIILFCIGIKINDIFLIIQIL